MQPWRWWRRTWWGLTVVLAGWGGIVSGRTILDQFNYTFDQGGSLEEFAHNDPEHGKVAWQAGGALGSLGCLKVTGPAINVERYGWFRAGANTISFHCLAHGVQQLECRLHVADLPGQQQRFGKRARQPIKLGAPDQWQFVQFPLAGVTGDAAGKPAVTAETVFANLSFLASEVTGPEAYLLIDNVRLGPAINEKDIAVKQRDQREAGKNVRVLLDGADPTVVGLLRPTVSAGPDGKDAPEVSLARVEQPPGSGRHALEITAAKDQPWRSFELDQRLLAGWQDYDFVAFDFETTDPHVVPFAFELWDDQSRNYATRATYPGAAGMELLPLHPGRTQLLVDVRRARRNAKEGLSFSELQPADKIDRSKLKRVKCWFVTEGLPADYVIRLERVRLLQEGALEAGLKVTLPPGARAFDFGEDSPVVAGFTQANLFDVWDGQRDYGFVNPEGLVAQGRDWPDPLTGDYLSGGHHGDDLHWRPASWEFRVKVPNGKYLAWVAAGFFPEPDLHADAKVNGVALFSLDSKGAAFYSAQCYFRFFASEYSEKPGALWQQFVQRMFPAHVTETEVTNGTCVVTGTNSFLAALVLVPVAERAAFDQMVTQIAAERQRYFYHDLYLDRPANEPCEPADPDLALFVPAAGRSIMPWNGRGPADAAAVTLCVTPGEKAPFQVAVRPFRDLGEATLSLSDLAGPGAARLPAAAATVFLKKYLCDGRRIYPWGLVPTPRVNLESGVARAWWLRLAVPPDAAPGIYHGTLTVQTAAVRRELPVTVTVQPFRLPADLPLAVGLYYNDPDGGQFAGYDRVRDFQVVRDRLLAEQMMLLRDYGMTSVQLPTPNIKEVREGVVTLDYGQMTKVAAAARAAGLLGRPEQQALVYTLGFGRALSKHLAGQAAEIGAELRLPGFAAAFTSAIRGLVDWSRAQEVPLVLWVVDEPREQPNPWNRNLADTISYLDLVGQVPGAVRMVTPMGDKWRDLDYTPLLDHLDIVATHATSHSQQMITRAMADPRITLWIYNTGKDRYSNGLYLWRVEATGKHEWHFCQWLPETGGSGYRGHEMHNPFVRYEHTAATIPAPLDYPGGIVPTEGLLTMSAGINDYRYLLALTRAIADCRARNVKAAEVADAERFLAALRQVVPVLPNVRNLATPDALALVGEGIRADGGVDLEGTRRQVAAWTAKLLAAP